jgi:uncharacterized protein
MDTLNTNLMRNNRLFTLLFLAWPPILSTAQHTILWKVTKPGNAHLSYLLGTFHTLGESFIDSFPVVKDRLLASDMLVSEAVVDRQHVADQYKDRTASDSLSLMVSADDLALIKKIFAKSSFDIEKMTPAELLLNLGIYYYQWGCVPRSLNDKWTCDEYIQMIARQNNKPAFYFEEDTMQDALLKRQSSYINWKYFHKMAPAVLRLYRRSSAPSGYCKPVWDFMAFDIDYDFGKKCQNPELVEDRNNRWMIQLPALLDQHNCFVDVGMQHLCNRCGLIMQLKAQGYVVEPVPMQ